METFIRYLGAMSFVSCVQLPPFPELHQRGGSHTAHTPRASDSLRALSLFHAARFIGKPTRLAVLQLPFESSRRSACDDLLMG